MDFIFDTTTTKTDLGRLLQEKDPIINIKSFKND